MYIYIYMYIYIHIYIYMCISRNTSMRGGPRGLFFRASVFRNTPHSTNETGATHCLSFYVSVFCLFLVGVAQD